MSGVPRRQDSSPAGYNPRDGSASRRRTDPSPSEGTNTIGGMIIGALERYGPRPALSSRNRSVSYAELSESISRISQLLIDNFGNRRIVIAQVSRNMPEMFVI